MFPHYRLAVIKEMQKSNLIKYTFIGDQKQQEGIRPIHKNEFESFIEAKYYEFNGIYIQPKSVKIALTGNFDAIIYLGNPNFLTSWVACAITKLRKRKLCFWTHGWLKKERPLKSLIRNLYYKNADIILTYNNRSAAQAKQFGFSGTRNIHPIYNSLDLSKSNEVYNIISNEKQSPSIPIFSCVARITKNCRFDQLIKASKILSERGIENKIELIGAGPELNKIEELAAELKVNLVAHGECYDENTIGKLIYRSIATVCPGKIGLSAIHSLSYGTPVITHDNLDRQMPEHEAILEGRTGSLFKENDIHSLAEAMEAWISRASQRTQTREYCRSEINQRWNPKTQAQLIENHMLNLLRND